MKIVFVSTLLPPNFIGGTEILTLLLAEALVQKGDLVTIYTGGKEKQRIEKGVLVKEIKELIFPSCLKSFFMPIYSYFLRKRLKKEKFFINADIINAVDTDSILALSGWKKIKNKFVATIQEYGLICPDGDLLYGKKTCPNFCHKNKGFLCLNKKKLILWKKVYFQLAYRFRKKIRDRKLLSINNAVCVSRFVANKISECNKRIRIKIISNCLPQRWWTLDERRKTKDIDLLYVGHLKSHKGLKFFLYALKDVLKKRKLKVFFVGGGNIKKYKNLSCKLGIKEKVSFTGEVNFDLIKNYYQRAKIVIIPSLWPEPCGRVIIEGMFFGAVVLGTDCGGTPESIIHRKTGFLFPPGNNRKLSKLILCILGSQKTMQKISRNAKSFARENFSPEKITAEYKHFFRLILKEQ